MFMSLTDVSTLSSIIQNLAVTIGIFVGGTWALYRFTHKRESETSLVIDVSTQMCSYSQTDYLVLIEVALKNTCQAKIEVMSPKSGPPVYSDDNEELRHKVSLQIRRVRHGAKPGDIMNWFDRRHSDSAHFELVSGEIDLLSSLDVPSLSYTHLCLEPNEAYCLSVPIVLSPGIYLLMVTFLGERPDFDFWRRFCLVEVPGSRLPELQIETSHEELKNG